MFQAEPRSHITSLFDHGEMTEYLMPLQHRRLVQRFEEEVQEALHFIMQAHLFPGWRWRPPALRDLSSLAALYQPPPPPLPPFSVP